MKTLEERRAWYREWIKTHRDQARESRRIWRENNREKTRELNRIWESNNKEKVQTKNKLWRSKNTLRIKVSNSTLHQNYKRTVIDAYGGHCKCCGENEIAFLTLEHTKKDGKIHRQVKGVFYLSLIRRRFPQDEGLSVLCMNCNWAERNGKQCPHKMAVKKVFEVIG